mmetsp:Transcript_15587/g.33673  ORF Transcript_15587/g.33673 Transcript_15587/m.33673 type:complete len:263 (-) Transcript_15587:768-1556(-)
MNKSFTKGLLVSLAVASSLILSTSFCIQNLLVQNTANSHVVVQHEAEAVSTTSAKLSKSLRHTPVGTLGPKGTIRHNYRYYDSLFYAAMQYGKDATSLIEVGCASDPFIKYLDWIDRRTCVAPYFVEYSGNDNSNSNTQLEGVGDQIERVTADFMEYDSGSDKYDLLICSQVLEHVPDPSAFMKKLINTAKTSVISVPFEWSNCGKKCNHLTDNITYEQILDWSAPHIPIYSSIIQEKRDKNGKESIRNKRRILVVFKPEDK